MVTSRTPWHTVCWHTVEASQAHAHFHNSPRTRPAHRFTPACSEPSLCKQAASVLSCQPDGAPWGKELWDGCGKLFHLCLEHSLLQPHSRRQTVMDGISRSHSSGLSAASHRRFGCV